MGVMKIQYTSTLTNFASKTHDLKYDNYSEELFVIDNIFSSRFVGHKGIIQSAILKRTFQHYLSP